MKKFDESNDKRYIFEIDANYPKTLQKAQSGLPFSQRKDENLSNIKNVRKHRDIKLVRNDKRRNYLTSEPNYHTKNLFSENLVAIEMNEINVRMNKSVYLVLSILDIAR